MAKKKLRLDLGPISNFENPSLLIGGFFISSFVFFFLAVISTHLSSWFFYPHFFMQYSALMLCLEWNILLHFYFSLFASDDQPATSLSTISALIDHFYMSIKRADVRMYTLCFNCFIATACFYGCNYLHWHFAMGSHLFAFTILSSVIVNFIVDKTSNAPCLSSPRSPTNKDILAAFLGPKKSMPFTPKLSPGNPPNLTPP